MGTHTVHRHVTWAWNNWHPEWGWRIAYQYDRWQENIEEPSLEASDVVYYQKDVQAARYGMLTSHGQGGAPSLVWPGDPPSIVREDRYYVALYGWAPGLPGWEWQWGTEVVHVPQAAGQRAIAYGPELSGTTLPVPGSATEPETKSRTGAIAVASAIGLVAVGIVVAVLALPGRASNPFRQPRYTWTYVDTVGYKGRGFVHHGDSIAEAIEGAKMNEPDFNRVEIEYAKSGRVASIYERKAPGIWRKVA